MYFAGWKKITARYVNRDAAQSNLPPFPAPVFRWLNVFFWKEEIPTSTMCNHERCLYAMIVALLLAVLKVVCWYLFDPYAYFEWVFEKLMHNPAEDELEELLPVNWVAAQRTASKIIEVEASQRSGAPTSPPSAKYQGRLC